MQKQMGRKPIFRHLPVLQEAESRNQARNIQVSGRKHSARPCVLDLGDDDPLVSIDLRIAELAAAELDTWLAAGS